MPKQRDGFSLVMTAFIARDDNKNAKISLKINTIPGPKTFNNPLDVVLLNSNTLR